MSARKVSQVVYQESPEEDWSIQSKRQQEKFQFQVVYHENRHHIICQLVQKLLSNTDVCCAQMYRIIMLNPCIY